MPTEMTRKTGWLYIFRVNKDMIACIEGYLRMPMYQKHDLVKFVSRVDERDEWVVRSSAGVIHNHIMWLPIRSDEKARKIFAEHAEKKIADAWKELHLRETEAQRAITAMIIHL